MSSTEKHVKLHQVNEKLDVSRIIKYSLDISDRKKAEEELRQAKEDAVEAWSAMEKVSGSDTESQASEPCAIRVLVAEDNPSNQMLIELILKKIGCESVIVSDGCQAVDSVKSQSFDLVLMDMQMPNMNGYEAATKLREEGFTLPIIAITANAMIGDRKECLDAGCSDYLSKPLSKEKLHDIINKHLPEKTLISQKS